MGQAACRAMYAYSNTTVAHDQTPSTIPVIDFQAFQQPDSHTGTRTTVSAVDRTKQEQVAAQVDEACRTIGFFYATGVGVPSLLKTQVLDVAKSFFELPLEQKETISMSKRQPYAYRGYQRLGENITNDKPDVHEAIDFLRAFRDNHRLVADWDKHKNIFYDDSECTSINSREEDMRWRQFVHGQNLYPSAESERILGQYVAACTAAGYRILSAMSLALQLDDANYIQKQYFDDPYWIVRFIQYPGTATSNQQEPLQQRKHETSVSASNQKEAHDDDNVFGVATHTDYGFLTLVHADDTPGALQVMVNDTDDGQFVTADPLQDAFVVNIGDMMAAFTNNEWVATPHRVVPTTTTRVSVPFFLEPNLDARVRPLVPRLERTTSEEGPEPEPVVQHCDNEQRQHDDGSVVYGRHLYSKLSTNFDFRQEQT